MNEKIINAVIITVCGVIGGLTGLVIAKRKTIKEMALMHELENSLNELIKTMDKRTIAKLEKQVKELNSKEEVKA